MERGTVRLNLDMLLKSQSCPRQAKAVAWVVISLLLVSASSSAMDAVTVTTPFTDYTEHGLNGYLRNRYAPLVGAIVFLISMIGHRCGEGKAWSLLMSFGMGMGLLVVTGGLVVFYIGDM